MMIQGDSLYVELEDERAKFSDGSLMKISDLLEFENDQYFIKIKAKRYKLKALR